MRAGKEKMQRLCALLTMALTACSARAGMFCQQDGDCRTGLICVHPPATGATADGGSHGICEPARRGQGEVCLWPSECQPPLVCSNHLGVFTGDGRHGRCQTAPASPDLAVADLPLPDLPTEADGGADDLAPPDGGG